MSNTPAAPDSAPRRPLKAGGPLAEPVWSLAGSRTGRVVRIVPGRTRRRRLFLAVVLLLASVGAVMAFAAFEMAVNGSTDQSRTGPSGCIATSAERRGAALFHAPPSC